VPTSLLEDGMSSPHEDIENQQQSHEERAVPGPSTATSFGPAGTPEPIYPGGKVVNYTSFVRFCMYIFFVFYLVSVNPNYYSPMPN